LFFVAGCPVRSARPVLVPEMGVWGLLSTVQMFSPPIGQSISFEPSRVPGREEVPLEKRKVIVVDAHAWAYHLFKVRTLAMPHALRNRARCSDLYMLRAGRGFVLLRCTVWPCFDSHARAAMPRRARATAGGRGGTSARWTSRRPGGWQKCAARGSSLTSSSTVTTACSQPAERRVKTCSRH